MPRLLVRAVVLLGATAAATALVDRWVLPDVLPAGSGRHAYRARAVRRPAGEPRTADVVFLRPLAGPARGRILPATRPPSIPLDRLLGRAVFMELRPDGGAVLVGIARDRLLLWLAGGLVALILLFAGGAGWRLMLVLLAGLASLVGILVPLLLRGVPPVVAAGATMLVFFGVAAALIGRGGRRMWAILVGSAGGAAVAGALSLIAVRAGRLTGVYSSLTKSLWYSSGMRGLDYPQLLAAGMIVGACAIILDLAAAVASAVHEVARANPALPRPALAEAGLSVGRDVMGTELNTLIFAHAGVNFGALLLPMLSSAVRGHEISALQTFSRQDVAAELLAMLIGTTALVLTIPITAAAGAVLMHRRTDPRARGGPDRTARVPWWPWVAVAGGVLAAWLGCLAWHARAFHRYARRDADPSGSARYLVQARVESVRPPAAKLVSNRAGKGREQIQQADCKLTSGPHRGQRCQVANAISGFPGHDKLLDPGEKVLLQIWVQDERVIYGTVIDFSRGSWLIHFAFLLLGAVVLVGRGKGLRALAALAFSAMILYPALLGVGVGAWSLPALPIFVLATLPLCAGVFLILGGATRKAASGSVGAFGGLLAGAVCAVLAARAMAMSGLESDSMAAIRNYTGAGLDYTGLLQAGMVLGIVGAAMDVAIAIASAVQEVLRAKPTVSRSELLRSALSVGRGIMIPMVLVLTFAYLGLSLPILMLPKLLPEQHSCLLLSNERISVEALRIVVGGIGIVCAVPLTAVVAAGLARRERTKGRTHAGTDDTCGDAAGG